MWVLVALLVVVGFICLHALMKISHYLRSFLRWPSQIPRSKGGCYDFYFFIHLDKGEEVDVGYIIESEGLKRLFGFNCLAKCGEEYYAASLSVVTCEVRCGIDNYTVSASYGNGKSGALVNCSEKSFDYLVGVINKGEPVLLGFTASEDKKASFVANDVRVFQDGGWYFISKFKEYLSGASQDRVENLSYFGGSEFLSRYNLDG